MTNKSTFSLSEDWVVVILGFLFIVAILSGLDIAVPVYNWNDFSELQEKVVSLPNLGKIALIFLVLLVVALLGGWLLNRLTRNWLIGFVVLYLLTRTARAVFMRRECCTEGTETDTAVSELTDWRMDLLTQNIFIEYDSQHPMDGRIL